MQHRDEHASTHDADARAQDADPRTQDADARAQDADARAQDGDARAHDADARAHDADARAHDADARAHDADARAQDADAGAQGGCGPAGDGARPANAADELVRRERFLPGSVEDAWALLCDADGLEQWLADSVDLIVKPGEQGALRDGDVVRDVLVDDVEEGRRLSLHWWTGDEEPSVVDLTLDVVDGRTRLVVTELPLRLATAPDLVPATWTTPGGGSQASSGPRLLALAGR